MHTINQLQLRPLIPIMRRMLERISRKDPADIFAEAVSVDEVSFFGLLLCWGGFSKVLVYKVSV